MDSSRWMVYVVVALVSVFSPGPAVLLAISNSVKFGLRRVAFSSLGNVIGLMLVSSLAMIGLGTILKSSAMLFGIIKFTGAAYLIFLGFKQWRSKENVFARISNVADTSQRSNRQLFLQAIMLALTNPKAILFFTALFPQFIDSERSLLPQFCILTTTFMVLSFGSLMTYALLAQTTRKWFSTQKNAQWFNRISGSIFMLLGIGLMRLKSPRS